MYARSTLHHLAMAAGVLLGVASAGSAQAAPTLTDPQRSIFRAFPAADRYRVIVRDVDLAARRKIEALLPFRVNFDELGAHSLYVAMRGPVPLGMVYVQHEDSAFGVATVEWAIALDRSISSFRFQRIRSAHRDQFEASAFVRSLKGQGREDLAKLLDRDGRLAQPVDGLVPQAQELAGVVARSGVKSIAVLEVIWGEQIERLRELNVGLTAFPTAVRFEKIWPRRIVAQAGVSSAPPSTDELASASVVSFMIAAYDDRDRLLGHVGDLRISWSTVDEQDVPEVVPPMRWVFDSGGRIVDVDPAVDLPSRLRAACRDMVGRSLADLQHQDDPIVRSLTAARALLPRPAGPGR